MLVHNVVRTTIAGTAALVLTLTACSSSKSNQAGAGGTTSTPPTSAASSASSSSSGAGGGVAVSLTNGLLAGPNGHTLYFNTVDTATAIECNGACATEWPPLTGTVKPGTGLDAMNFGTAKRSDGSTQITYFGHPLYYFAGDAMAGQKNGNELKDEGGEWYATTPHEAQSEKPGDDAGKGASTTPSSSSAGGYTY